MRFGEVQEPKCSGDSVAQMIFETGDSEGWRHTEFVKRRPAEGRRDGARRGERRGLTLTSGLLSSSINHFNIRRKTAPVEEFSSSETSDVANGKERCDTDATISISAISDGQVRRKPADGRCSSYLRKRGRRQSFSSGLISVISISAMTMNLQLSISRDSVSSGSLALTRQY